MLELTGVWDMYIFTVTGVLEFDYFFTLVVYCGLMGVIMNMLVRVISRS